MSRPSAKDTGPLDDETSLSEEWNQRYQAHLRRLAGYGRVFPEVDTDMTHEELHQAFSKRFLRVPRDLESWDEEGELVWYEYLMPTAYVILRHAPTPVGGLLGGILYAEPSYDEWLGVTRSSFMRHLVMLRTALEVTQGEGVFRVFYQLLHLFTPVKAVPTFLDKANDRLLDALYYATQQWAESDPRPSKAALLDDALNHSFRVEALKELVTQNAVPELTLLLRRWHFLDSFSPAVELVHHASAIASLPTVMVVCRHALHRTLPPEHLTLALALAEKRKASDVVAYLSSLEG